MLIRFAVKRGCSVILSPPFYHHGSVFNRCSPVLTLVSQRCKATQKSAEEEIDLDAPIKFSTSRAATWKSRETYSGKATEVNKRPWVPHHIQLRTFCICNSPSLKKRIPYVLMPAGWSQNRLCIRYVSDWYKRTDEALKTNRPLILTLTLGVFMAYFLMLRQPSDIDEYLSRPIWERVPGIDPERAEQMMQMDKNLGLQVDYTGLEDYKKKYYAEKLQVLETEAKAEKRHRELRESMSSHQDMLKAFAERKSTKE